MTSLNAQSRFTRASVATSDALQTPSGGVCSLSPLYPLACEHTHAASEDAAACSHTQAVSQRVTHIPTSVCGTLQNDAARVRADDATRECVAAAIRGWARHAPGCSAITSANGDSCPTPFGSFPTKNVCGAAGRIVFLATEDFFVIHHRRFQHGNAAAATLVAKSSLGRN